jgi:hypothetical protein
VRPGFGLPRSAQCRITDGTRSKQLGLLTEAICLLGQTFFKGSGLLEMAALLHLRGSVP